VLLEVVLALVLFAGAATVIGIALNASMTSVERLRMSARATDLSVTVFSELQLGVRSIADTGPEAFGLEVPGWTWEVAATPWGGAESASKLTRVEVTILYDDKAVHRAAQVMRLPSAEPGASAAVVSKGVAVR